LTQATVADHEATKQRIRREVRAARRGLDTRQLRQASERLARRLGHAGTFLRAETIAYYVPADGEVDPRPLMERARAFGKRCFLPVIHGKLGGRLFFAPYTPGTPLVPNRFGIPEPVVPRRDLRSARQLDLVLAPLVAFRPDGARLGMGGGFYDRTLAGRARVPAWRRPRVVGLALELQKRDDVPRDPWDVPMDGVATEEALYPATPGGFR
jgi:5-formyltetrahydrofolate cyclo-ligase